MASYKVYFAFECSPDTHWGEDVDEEIIIEGDRTYKDGDVCFGEAGEESTISSWEDCVDDIDARWEGDSLSEFDFIDHAKKNPHDNGKSEFEDGTGDVNFETLKVEIYSDDEWNDLVETKNL